MVKSKLISFEGIDGSGKSTLIQLVSEELNKLGLTTIVLQEPGTTLMGLELRKLLKSEIPRAQMTEVLMFMASRADMVNNVITPAMKNYDVVLIDRYIDSTVAYQGYSNGIDLNTIQTLNRLAVGNNLPHKTILVDVDLKTAEKRRKERQDDVDKFDTNQAFAKKVYAGYQQIALENPDRVQVVKNEDISTSVDEIVSIIVSETKRRKEHRRESLAKQSKSVKESATYRAVVQRPGKDENGNPTILLAQVKRKGGRKVLTDHAWIKYNRELVKAGTLVYNDVIEFDATIEEYEHEGKFSRYMEYGLTDIKNVQIVKAVKIPKNDENFERKDLNHILAIADEELFNKTLVKYTGFVSAMNHKLWIDVSN